MQAPRRKAFKMLWYGPRQGKNMLCPLSQAVHTSLKQQLGMPQQMLTSVQDLTKENLEYLKLDSERLNNEKVRPVSIVGPIVFDR